MLRVFAFVLALLVSPVALAGVFNYQPSLDGLEQEFESGNRVSLARKTDAALEGMIRLAVWKLQRTGHNDEAIEVWNQWDGFYRGYLVREVMKEGLGDHEPLSRWLADVYAKLVDLFGESAVKFMHLDDINIANFAIPVVFHMKQIGGDVIDAPEYALHFVPFSGVVAYWGTWGACEAVTMGTGWFIVCTPAGMAAEYVTVTYIAPRFSDRVWARFY